MTMDTIALTGLRLRGFHGVFPEERERGQIFVVDLEIRTDLRPAAMSDDLADTIDYGAIAQAVADVVTGEPCDLIETVAERICAVVLVDERVHSVRLVLHKPEAPIPLPFDDVAIVFERGRT